MLGVPSNSVVLHELFKIDSPREGITISTTRTAGPCSPQRQSHNAAGEGTIFDVGELLLWAHPAQLGNLLDSQTGALWLLFKGAHPLTRTHKP